MNLFEYAVIYTPKSENEPAKVLVPVTTVLANSKENATLIAARSIPEEYLDRLDQVKVAVRPF